MSTLIAGGAGFVGANLVGALLARGQRVLVADNLSRGSLEWLAPYRDHPSFAFAKVDLARPGFAAALQQARPAWAPVRTVWHLAANSDIPAGVADPQVDLDATFLTTFHLLNFMREVGATRLAFASSSAIYGDFGEREITEDIGPLMPLSNYGAMKLASEAQISAAVESGLAQGFLFRFPNVVGVPATHGVILDFVRKLKSNPGRLEVLGDGSQQKAYLHVSDLVAAMLFAFDTQTDKRVVLNIGPADAGVTVRWIAEQVVARVAPRAQIVFGTGNRGWVGDVPRFRYSVAKLRAAGWQPQRNSQQAIAQAVDEIARQEGF